MSLYDLAAEINLDQMKPSQIGFIWRVGTNAAFLQRGFDAVDLCVIGSGKFRMYTRTNGAWRQAPREEYDAWVKQIKQVKQVKAGTQTKLNI